MKNDASSFCLQIIDIFNVVDTTKGKTILTIDTCNFFSLSVYVSPSYCQSEMQVVYVRTVWC